jgi:hypothetical protein
MTDADLQRKFADMSEPVIGAARTRELVAKTWGIGKLTDAGELSRASA